MDEPRKRYCVSEKGAKKDSMDSDNLHPESSATQTKRAAAHGDRSPKPKDGEKLRERLAKSKHVWRKESMEKRPKSGPLVAKHSFNKSSNLRLDTAVAHSLVSRSSLRPTSPTYESAFKRQVVNRPHSPGVSAPNRRLTHTNSFSRGSKRALSPHASTNPEELMRRRIEKAKRAKLYLLQQAGPNTFTIAGGESQDHRHKVTIGPQSCTCGRGHHCIHILFVMVRVFELASTNPFIHAKALKNFEVESLFRKYESRRKQRLWRSSAASICSSSSPETEHTLAVPPQDTSSTDLKMEPTCPICLLDLLQTSQHLVHCDNCHNKLHNDCMAVWYELVKKQGDTLTCPLCRSVWPSSNTISFSHTGTDSCADTHLTAGAYNASPNSLGTSPVTGFVDIEPSTLLPRSQPIPLEHAELATPWVEMFGEDLIGCLFMKNEWVMRETALRHLSRETIMLLSHPSEQDMTSSPTSQPSRTSSTSSQSSVGRQSCSQSRIEYVLEISCQILTMMVADPVYKVYVASLRSLRTMLCYCSLADVTKLRVYMKPVIQSIVLKCADGNRKTNQLSISTLSEFAKGQQGELAIGRELNLQGQTGLGGCIYVFECCMCCEEVDHPSIQWLNGRLLTINQLLEDHHTKFSPSNMGELEFSDFSHQILFAMIEFAVMAVTKAGNKTRTIRYAKKVILHCSKLLSALPGMSCQIKDMLVEIEPELRGRLEKCLLQLSVSAQQAAIHAANSKSSEMDNSVDISESRAGSPPASPPASPPPDQMNRRAKAKRPLVFGSLYHAPSFSRERPTKSNTVDTLSTSRLPRHRFQHPRRSDSYTEAVHKPLEAIKTRSLDETFTGETKCQTPEVLLSRQLSSSTESVEADYVTAGKQRVLSPKLSADTEIAPEVEDREAISSEQLEVEQVVVVREDADVTLTESLCDATDYEEPHQKSPRKLSRGRVVSGSKPQISVRHELEHNDVEVRDVEQSFDVVDGLRPHTAPPHSQSLTVPPLLQSHTSMGFDTMREQLDSLDMDDELETREMIAVQDYATDSESCTDNISQSVSLSLSTATSDDNECDELSDNEPGDKSYKDSVPFGGYRRSKHSRSKTDPFRSHKVRAADKSPRYHSDPAGGNSATSSAASTPRSPPPSSSSVVSDGTSADIGDGTAVVRPVSRALTFSQPSTNLHQPSRSRPQSTRSSKSNVPHFPPSRLPSRVVKAFVSPNTSDTLGVAAAKIASAGLCPRQQPEEQPQSSSPPLPAAIRALTPPTSPLKIAKSSTPIHTPPSSPPSFKDTLSRSPSPPGPPITAIVRPQANYAAKATRDGTEAVTPTIQSQTAAFTVEPSHPVQRQTSTSNLSSMIAASTSSGSDDPRVGTDSLYVEELSDSAVASPYEQEVSFKTEVALFSPRNSVEEGNCHCKDEVELEEAIALAKAMEISTDQTALPQVPGLSARRQEETITIHVQPDQTDAKGDQVEYLEDIHWRRGMMIGTGAFSTCYQCRDVTTGIIMAVKQISFCRNSESEQESICKAVIDEIRMMATLNHSNIVRILGATQTGAHFNMFVEWMPGGSVSHLLERYGAFSEPVITSYTQQVLMGLAYLHDHHILHRDMKGANLLVDSTGKHLRIGDFGACAQLASSMTGAGELKGQLLGTIAFMAPEVLRGEHYGRACDVWSVGCVIIEMVTTKPPWNASNVSNHLKLIFTIASANTSPPVPENLPPPIKDLMLRCLETESKNRPPAKELLQHPLFTRSHYRRR